MQPQRAKWLKQLEVETLETMIFKHDSTAYEDNEIRRRRRLDTSMRTPKKFLLREDGCILPDMFKEVLKRVVETCTSRIHSSLHRARWSALGRTVYPSRRSSPRLVVCWRHLDGLGCGRSLQRLVVGAVFCFDIRECLYVRGSCVVASIFQAHMP